MRINIGEKCMHRFAGIWAFTAFVLAMSTGIVFFKALLLAILGRFYIVYWIVKFSGVIPWIQKNWMI